MTATHEPAVEELDDTDLKRSITGRQLFFYVLGDVLGSGIYVLIGAVAAAVGGAFWLAFLVGVTVATLTGMAYAELVTKYPRAAGASLYVNRAFGIPAVTFLVTVAMLASSFAASGSLAAGFSGYFAEVWAGPPALLVSILFVVALCVINFIGITESVVANVAMTLVEITGLLIVVLIGLGTIFGGDADFAVLVDFDGGDNWMLALIAGVALGFFAMTGFENAANVAEECTEPRRTFPKALVGGMVGAGIVYVTVAIAAALTVPVDQLAASKAALLEVVETGFLGLPQSFLSTLFAVIAMVAITNTTLVTFVTQSRILYGMANEDVVPNVFAKVHSSRRSPWVGLLFSGVVVAGLLVASHVLPKVEDVSVVERLAAVTVLLLLFVYASVIVSALKLRGEDETPDTYRAPTLLLLAGLVGNLVLLGYVVYDDPTSLWWSLALIGLGVVLFVLEYFFGSNDRPEGVERGDPAALKD
ncbi:APC family permease [Nocardioides sp. SYSU D00038]|uniref:APC family permease n=1 Tax=Nocardioides sp. SYSU D00038 TaxID=2812554 RepID=UPI0019678C70|nr:APC family permease [Nocardioides sp. SYSU D00038]